jgi:hypothetical protein
MNALTLLQEVSTAYRILHTLSLEATIVTESGDENANNRNLHRIRFLYTHPNLLRFEPVGKDGTTVIADGQQIHTIFRRRPMAPGPQHSSVPIAKVPGLPKFFRWDIPHTDALLFHYIDQHVASAEILRQEDGCHVVSATYEGSHYNTTLPTNGWLFWIDSITHMVMRSQVDIGHRRPAEDEITWTRHSLSVQQICLNEPILPETFQFTPPRHSNPLPRGRRLSFGGGSGGIRTDPTNPQRSIENYHSHDWEGDTLVEISKWKLRGKTLTFERRLTFSDGDSNITVDEHIVGPAEDHKSRYNLKIG